MPTAWCAWPVASSVGAVTLWPRIREMFTTSGRPSLWDATAYLATDIIVGTIAFTVVIAGLATTVGLAVTFILAIPVAWATVKAARWFGAVERWRLWAFFDLDVPAPPTPDGETWFRRLKADVRDRPTWRQIAHALLQLPAGVMSFAAVTAVWAIPLGLLTVPLIVNQVPSERLDFWVGVVRPGWVPVALAVLGLALLPLGALATRHLARLRSRMSIALLAPTEADVLRARVTRLEDSRSRVVDAAEGERRRIERDLHDGAQQRLIALALDLGMAREKLSSDPDGARALLDEAHDEAKRAIVELRDLARGIHPAVLTDRGLGAALATVAGRSPVPVQLTVDLDERPPSSIEGIAYFIVSEALANVAKHSGATSASVTIAKRAANLVIEVSDDGIGGADTERGTGLTGLRDRVAGVDGWFHLSSPAGGPTTLTVELPCAS